ncbi:MAG: hypothetical protein GKS07_08065 [Nitrosopumilus sp.]|nr:MAG: hypothetical protein GKS07_08065 [Nitrosopumilus sp.]
MHLSFIKFNQSYDDVERKVLDHYMSQVFVAIHYLKSNEFKVMQNLKKIPEIIEAGMLIGN